MYVVRVWLTTVAGPVKLVHASLNVRKDLESSFHRCGGPMKLVQVSLSARKDLESSLHGCGCPVKFVQARIRARKDQYIYHVRSRKKFATLWRIC